jgi:serine/threonine protein kinase
LSSDKGTRNSADAIAGFRREAGLLAHLDHPNIPKVTDFFTEVGKHDLVMELVPGETLEERLARQGTWQAY